MSRVLFGLIAGGTFGVVDLLLMIPLDLPDKKVAMTAAFLNRFAIGFLVPLVKMPAPSWANGAIVGLLISLPDAVITKAYGPIIGVGIVGGARIGWAAGRGRSSSSASARLRERLQVRFGATPGSRS